MGNFCNALKDIVVAILRLVMLQLVLFVTGLHHILFNCTEVANVTLALIPQRRYREKLTFVDNLRANNLDVDDSGIPMPLSGCDSFQEDEYYLEEGDTFDDDDSDEDKKDDKDDDSDDNPNNGGKE